MKKLITILATMMVALFASSAFAWDPPASPAPTSWISDPGHVLSDDAHARLDAKLRQINQSSANEMAALILPSLDGQDITDVGDKTALAWGVGKKGLDNGVLVVLGMAEHKSRISTGKGVEGDLPDLKCNDILKNARPYLRSGNIEGALGFIFDQSSGAIANHKAEVASGHSTATGTSSNTACDVSAVGVDGGGLAAILGLVAFFIVVAVLGNRRRQRIQAEEDARNLRLRQEQAQRMAAARAMREQREREEALNKPTPVVEIPIVRPASRPVAPSFPAAPPRPEPSVSVSTVVETAAAVTAAAAATALAEQQRHQHEAELRRRREQAEREEADRKRRRREQDEEDERRRRRSSDDSGSGGSWGGGGSDSGGSGGFGGGDFGGGGSSSDW